MAAGKKMANIWKKLPSDPLQFGVRFSTKTSPTEKATLEKKTFHGELNLLIRILTANCKFFKNAHQIFSPLSTIVIPFAREAWAGLKVT